MGTRREGLVKLALSASVSTVKDAALSRSIHLVHEGFPRKVGNTLQLVVNVELQNHRIGINEQGSQRGVRETGQRWRERAP